MSKNRFTSLASTQADRAFNSFVRGCVAKFQRSQASAPSDADRRGRRTAAYKNLGTNFSSEDVELGLKVGDALERLYGRS